MLTRICPHIDCQTRVSQPSWDPPQVVSLETSAQVQPLLDGALNALPSLTSREAKAALGRSLFTNGRYEEAQATLEAAQAEPGGVPADADLWLLQGFCKERTGATGAGLPLWLLAFAEDPERFHPLAGHVMRRVDRQFVGEYGEWVLSTWLPELRERSPAAASSDEVLAMLGLITLALGRIDEANRWLTGAVTTAGERALALLSTVEEVASRWDTGAGGAAVATAIARLWMLAGEEERALAEIENVLTHDASEEAHRLRASLFERRGDVEAAVADRREAGRRLIVAGRFADALPDFKWVVDRAPDDQETHWLTTLASYGAATTAPLSERAAGLRGALKVWDHARTFGPPTTAWPWGLRGDICWSLSAADEPAEAGWAARSALAYETALMLSPDEADHWLAASVQYRTLEAAETATYCLRRAEETRSSLLQQGWGATQGLLHALAYNPDAVADELIAYRQDPQHEESTALIVEGYQQMWAEQRDAAVVSFRRAIEAEPEDAYAFGGLVRALSLSGRDEEALDGIHRIRDLLPKAGPSASLWWKAYSAAALRDHDELVAVHEEAQRDAFEASYAGVLVHTTTALARASEGDADGAAGELRLAAADVRYAGDVRELWTDAAVAEALLRMAGVRGDVAIGPIRESLRERVPDMPSGSIDLALAEVEHLLEDPQLARQAQSAFRARRASLLAAQAASAAVVDGGAGEAADDEIGASSRLWLKAAQSYHHLLADEELPEADAALASCLRSLLASLGQRPFPWAKVRGFLANVTSLLPKSDAYPDVAAAVLEWALLAELATTGKSDPADLGEAMRLRGISGEEPGGIGERWSRLLTGEEYWRLLDALAAQGGKEADTIAGHLRATLDDRHRSNELLWWFVTPIVVEVGQTLEDSARSVVPPEGQASEKLRAELQAKYGIRPPAFLFRAQPALGPRDFHVQIGEVVRARETVPPEVTEKDDVSARLLAGLAEALVDHLDELLTLDAVDELLGRWTEAGQGHVVELAKELRESPEAFTRLASVLRSLLAERVPIVDGFAVMEGIRLAGGPRQPPETLLRAVRLQLAPALPGNDADRKRIDVPAAWEEAAGTPGKSAPSAKDTFELLRDVRSLAEEQGPSVLVTRRPELRSMLARMVAEVTPDLPVLAADELRPEPTGVAMGRARTSGDVEGVGS